MEAINIFFSTLFEDSGILILLFFVTGIAFNVFGEIVKKQIFPKLTEDESAAGKKQKDCPRWIGMLIGIALTGVFLACAISASLAGMPHCSLIGGMYFVPVWAVAYYVWQIAAMQAVKSIMKLMFPRFMTGKGRPEKPKKVKVYRVPAGATVEYTGDDDINV